jgi:hypothetical protein
MIKINKNSIFPPLIILTQRAKISQRTGVWMVGNIIAFAGLK